MLTQQIDFLAGFTDFRLRADLDGTEPVCRTDYPTQEDGREASDTLFEQQAELFCGKSYTIAGLKALGEAEGKDYLKPTHKPCGIRRGKRGRPRQKRTYHRPDWGHNCDRYKAKRRAFVRVSLWMAKAYRHRGGQVGFYYLLSEAKKAVKYEPKGKRANAELAAYVIAQLQAWKILFGPISTRPPRFPTPPLNTTNNKKRAKALTTPGGGGQALRPKNEKFSRGVARRLAAEHWDNCKIEFSMGHALGLSRLCFSLGLDWTEMRNIYADELLRFHGLATDAGADRYSKWKPSGLIVAVAVRMRRRIEKIKAILAGDPAAPYYIKDKHTEGRTMCRVARNGRFSVQESV